MAGPVYRYDADATDDSPPLARVLGRPLVPAQQRRAERQARAAVRPGDRQERRPAGLGRQPARHAELGRGVHGLEVRARRRALRAGLRRLLPRGRERRHLALRLHRRGADTPGASPKAFPIGGYEVRFSSAGSGGVAYEWDFGDGSPVSTEPNPTHTYAEAKPYTATLTVTYADGSKDSKEIDLRRDRGGRRRRADDHGDDHPANPERDQARHGDAHGDRRRRQRRRRGPSTASTAAPGRSTPGRSSSPSRTTTRSTTARSTGRTTPRTAKTLTFTITVLKNCTPDLNDEFDGTTLSDA